MPDPGEEKGGGTARRPLPWLGRMGVGTIGAMTAKELVLEEAPTWTEEQAERALRAAHRDVEEKPGDIIDDWGNLSAMKRRSSARLMKRLDEEEIAEFGETIAEAWGYEKKNAP